MLYIDGKIYYTKQHKSRRVLDFSVILKLERVGMDRQDWYKMGTQIGDLVQSAIENQDFKRLNETITNTINATVEMVQKNVQEGIERESDRTEQKGSTPSAGSWKAAYEQAAKKRKQRTSDGKRSSANHVYRSGEAGGQIIQQHSSKALKSYKGITYMTVGYTLAGIFGILTLVFGILSRVLLPLAIPSGIFGVLTVVCWVTGARGRRFQARLKRQKQYLNIMGERDTCSLEELAAGTGKSKKFVKKDLREMIQNHMFPQGAYLDAQETCFMTSHAAYRQYQDTIRQYEQRKKQQLQEENRWSEKEKEYSKEIQKILNEGKQFLAHIRACNDRLPGEQISDKLDRLENVVARIFDQVSKNPESAPDLRKMMSYYLPITQKLVDAYVDLDEQPAAGRNIAKTKQEIEDSLDTVNTAFENLLDSFFQDTAWDISSDISVLHTMMAQDGLMEKDFPQ